MNAIQIKNLINQIGELNTNFNKQSAKYLLNNEDVIDINLDKFEEIKTEYQQKLIVQLKQKSDIKLLQEFLKDVIKNIDYLENNYHGFRKILSDSSLLDKEYIIILKKTCKIIDAKIIVLEKIKLDLAEKIKYHDYKLDNDFGGEEFQSNKDKPFEDDELELSGVPKLNLSNRFKLLKTLKIVDALEELKIDKKQKTILLALTMGINIDNARHLLSNTYPDPPKSKERELEHFFIKYKINI
nr:hypothetical protein [uncultured Flavobacterium sp.]